ncbi:MAG TPA: hypothetical protein PLT03_03340 [Bacillota bacterium]|nr:hypothetical protein [Bacillota bacterium]
MPRVRPEDALTFKELPTSRLKEFVKLAFDLYRGDRNWVPPLINDQIKTLSGKDNKFISESEHAFFLGYRKGRPVSRVMVAANGPLSAKQGLPIATFSLVEGEDEEALSSIIRKAEGWAKEKGCRKLIGPWSPSNGEDGIGLMVQGFEDPPVLLNSYNKRWYASVLEGLGYSKLADFVGYRLTESSLPSERLARAAEIALARAHVVPSKVEMSKLEEGLSEIFSVMSEAFSASWYNDMPTWEEFRKLAGPLSRLADPDLIWLAKDIDTGRAVAFIVALPDWNQVLIKMRGRIFPIGWLHYLRARKTIKRVRLMMQYCIKEYQGSSVIPALYAKVVENAVRKGMSEGEASVILETNLQSRRAIEALGGKLSRVYRWYSKDI